MIDISFISEHIHAKNDSSNTPRNIYIVQIVHSQTDCESFKLRLLCDVKREEINGKD